MYGSENAPARRSEIQEYGARSNIFHDAEVRGNSAPVPVSKFRNTVLGAIFSMTLK
jgi:hypothetical protein